MKAEGASLGGIFRLAARLIAGGRPSFLAFIISLALGIAIVAGIGSLAAAIDAGLTRDARAILGGDIELRLTYREADPREKARLLEAGRLSHIVEMRAMAKGKAPLPTLVEVKAIDEAYPLFGALRLDPLSPRDRVFGPGADGLYGIAIDRSLGERLGIGLGDRIEMGSAQYRVAAFILGEPDRVQGGFALGPRLMLSLAALEESGLVKPGALVYHSYRLALKPDIEAATWVEKLRADFPTAGWRIRGLDDAGRGIRDFIGEARLFLILIGFGALILGGLGIANAVSAYLEGEAATLAILKCLGAHSGLIFTLYGIAIAGAAAIGIGCGLLIGALAPILLGGLLRNFGLDLEAALYPAPLLTAALLGGSIALLFSLSPLLRARRLNAAQLFRARILALGDMRAGDRWRLAMIATFVGLIAILDSGDWRLGLGFVIAAAAAIFAFRLLGLGLHRLAEYGSEALGKKSWPLPWRLALRALARSRHTIGMVALSLGLGLTILVAIGLIERSLAAAIAKTLPEKAPSFYFIDIQPDQIEPLRALLADYPGATDFASVPMLRGRITAIKGQPAEKIAASEDVDWVLRGDRGITWAASPPPSAEIVAGNWWPADYQGPLLVSFDAEAAAGLGLAIGDEITVNILGRDMVAKIANLRRIDWSGLAINFVMIFSPGEIEAAPQTYIATIHVEREAESGLIGRLARDFPNVSAISVRDALTQIAGILGHLGWAIRAAAAIVILIGTIVLGNVVAGQRRLRLYEAILMKTLGARRRDLVAAYAIEFLILGGFIALLALGLGAAAAYLLITLRFEAVAFSFPIDIAILALALALGLVLSLGFAGTWRALGAQAAPYLRND